MVTAFAILAMFCEQNCLVFTRRYTFKKRERNVLMQRKADLREGSAVLVERKVVLIEDKLSSLKEKNPQRKKKPFS